MGFEERSQQPSPQPNLGRFQNNWRGLSRALRRASPPRLSWQRVTVMALAALALIVVDGLIFDAPVAARTHALPAAVTAFFRFATRFGKSDWLLIPTAVLIVLVGVGDWRRPPRLVASAWQEIGAFAGVFFVAIALSGIVNDVFKPLVGRSRPNAPADAVAFSPFTFGYAHASFPSGHANTMAALAVVAILALGARSLPIVAAAMIVAISRVFLGVHYVSDVAAGLLLGGTVAYLVVAWAASAGIGFRFGPSGLITPRMNATHRILSRPGGLGAMLAGLWTAIAGG